MSRRLVHYGLAAAALVFAAAALAAALWVIAISEHTVTRTEAARTQYDALVAVDAGAARYGRQAANQLLFGYERGGPLQSARNEMERALANLTRATRAEMETLWGEDELREELQEVELVRRMVDLYHAIDRSTTDAMRLAQDGDAAGARDILQRQVDFRLTNELQPLIATALADESAEIAGRVEALEAWRRTMLIVGMGAVALVLAVGVVVAIAGRRARDRRLAALAGGLAALGGGTPAGTGDAFADLEAEAGRLAETLAAERAEAAAAAAEARRAGDRLLVLNEARAGLLADVGHQLRTPLTALRGEADVALRGPASAEALREALMRVREQAIELGQLLEHFIGVARTAEENPVIERLPLRLDDLVETAIREIGILLDSRELGVDLDLRSSAEVSGDARYLKQAVIVGLDNAIKHSPPGGRIEVSTACEEGRAVIRVEDHGTGVSEEDLPHVFERFYRGSHEDELLNLGFGIGLSVARDIVERHDGRVTLGNRPGGGAVFTISLPVLQPVA